MRGGYLHITTDSRQSPSNETPDSTINVLASRDGCLRRFIEALLTDDLQYLLRKIPFAFDLSRNSGMELEGSSC